MKKIINYILVLGAVFGTAQATAIVLLPYLFAQHYCALRKAGVTEDAALSAAIKESAIEGTPTKVLVGNKYVDADSVTAVETASQLCPQFFE